MTAAKLDRGVYLAIAVAALGYFVDIYDLLLFSIVRVASLRDLGFSGADLTAKGVWLLNLQMAGLLVGGIFWGILGDKRGRLSVLFGSICLYSLANFANAFVSTIEQYAALRFLAGIGLAGELGAGITLVAEILPQNLRGYGTSFVAAIGILGAVAGGLIGDIFAWRTAFMIGGVLGLGILVLRIGVHESPMFAQLRQRPARRGEFLTLFTKLKNFRKYFAVILIGMPLWYVVGILITFSPEIGRAFGMTELPSAGHAVMFNYLGLTFGDFGSGLMSQMARNRRRVILFYILLTIAMVTLHLALHRLVTEEIRIYYGMCFLMGLGCGYWALFVTVAAEQFGTNIRATVTTTVPNFVRGSVIPLTILFQALAARYGVIGGAALTGTVTFALALAGLSQLEETFHKDLNYLED